LLRILSARCMGLTQCLRHTGARRTNYSGVYPTPGTLMSSIENKQLMQQVFAELAKGNGKPFVDSMADDFQIGHPGNVGPNKGKY
jgi:hypothetical protein